jgi:hypothetical protein
VLPLPALSRVAWLVVLLGLAGCVAEPAHVPAPVAVSGRFATPAEADDSQDEVHVTLGGLVADWQRDGEWLVSPPLAVPVGVQRVGALLELADGAQVPRLEAQVLQDGKTLAPWQLLRTTWSEGALQVQIVQFALRGTAAQVRVRADEVDRLVKLQWNATVPAPTADSGDALVAAYEQKKGALTASLDGLGIVTRTQWQARPTKCTDKDGKARYRLAIHHTETPSDHPAQRVRAIQAFHMDARGWCDIGYHFLVGADGTLYEGRPYDLLGAHVGGQNSGNLGISFIGCFHTKGCDAMPPTTPPAVMLDSAARLLGTLRELEGIALSRATVKGHRDHQGASTDCPGDNLYAKIDQLIAQGQKVTLKSPAGTVTPDPPKPTPDPPKPATCAELGCGLCSPGGGCQWCASKGTCQDGSGVCAWHGYVGVTTCWPTLWPCTTGSCWNPKQDLAKCGGFTVDEDFSSGQYNVHRYWTQLPAGAPITLTLQRTAGTWAPALIVTDQAGKLVAGGDVASLHPQVQVTAAVSGRTGDAATVTLVAKQDTAAFLLVTSWGALDAGFFGKIPTDAKYHLTASQPCAAPTPPSGSAGLSAVHAGLTQAGMQIPRAGLANATLQSVFGLTTEPYGTSATYAGLAWVQGKVSEFGGPKDTGVTPTETGSISGEKLRALNDPLDPDAKTLAANPGQYFYLAMRFDYQPAGKAWWKTARLIVANPKNGKAVVVRPVDWGPNVSTKRVGDLAPEVRKELGLQTDDDALFAFAKPGSALGIVAK